LAQIGDSFVKMVQGQMFVRPNLGSEGQQAESRE
jgi:hypothetical protein